MGVPVRAQRALGLCACRLEMVCTPSHLKGEVSGTLRADGIKVTLYRMREPLVKFRTAQSNGLRVLLTEYGGVMPQGRTGIKRDVPGALGRLSNRLPAMVIEILREQYARLGELDEQIGQIVRRLRQWQSQDSTTQPV